MNDYNGVEKRKFIRLDAKYVVSYSKDKSARSFNVSQTKNVSQGGAIFTTDKKFETGTCLKMILKFPFLLRKVKVAVEVVSSTELENSLFETSVKFLDLDKDIFQQLGRFIKGRKE